MEWVIAVLAVALLVYYVLPRRTPRTFDGVPTITPDMIHPRDRPPTRIEAATAYRNFCFRYLGSPADPRENTDVADFLAMLSADIQALDPVRDETANRIKEAMNLETSVADKPRAWKSGRLWVCREMEESPDG